MAPHPATLALNATMSLADFTKPSLIIPDLRGRDAATVIQELSHVLQLEGCIPDLLPFYHAALNREFMVSTDMESGMAFPHARLPNLPEVAFAFGRSRDPLDWGAKASGSVTSVFLMAVPATDSTKYLLLISGLVRLAKSGPLVSALQQATDAFAIHELFRKVHLRSNNQILPVS